MFVLIFWSSFTLGPPFLVQKFRLLLPNTSGGWGLPPAPGRERAAPQASWEDTARGHMVNFPVTCGVFPALMYSLCFCLFCVRQKLPEVDKPTSNRLWPSPNTQASKGLRICRFLHRPRSSQAEGSRSQDSTKAKAPAGCRAFSSGPHVCQ